MGDLKRGEWHRLPDARSAVTHPISEHCYVTAGFYEDDSVGEVFISLTRGTNLEVGMANTIAKLISLALQYGVPLPILHYELVHTDLIGPIMTWLLAKNSERR